MSPRDKVEERRQEEDTSILVNSDEEFAKNTVCLCVVCVCERACEGNAVRERERERERERKRERERESIFCV